jgi:hypothetical protein
MGLSKLPGLVGNGNLKRLYRASAAVMETTARAAAWVSGRLEGMLKTMFSGAASWC